MTTDDPDHEAASPTDAEQVIVLSPEDQRRFVQALLDSPPPGERLKRAARHYRSHVEPRDLAT